MKTKQSWPLLVAGLLISGICLYLALRGLSIRETLSSIRQADIKWILGAFVIYGAGFYIRSCRWSVILRPLIPVRAKRLYPILMIGFLGNNVLPFRMGELLRAHVCGRQLSLSRTACLGSIFLERVFDMFTFVLLFLMTAFFLRFPPDIERAAHGMGIVAAIAVAGLLALLCAGDRVASLIRHLPLRETWTFALQRIVTNILNGLSILKSPKQVAAIAAMSMVVWGIEGTVLYTIAKAFPVEFSFSHAFFLLFFLAVSVALPQAPGYIGTMEFFGVMALSLLGIPRENGLPLILTIHGFQFLFIGIAGVMALTHEGLNIHSIRRDIQDPSGGESHP